MYKRLAYHPTWPAVGKALTLWAALLLVVAILLVGGLLALGALLPGPGWNQPPLDAVSSVGISSGQETVWLAGKHLDCGPADDVFRCVAIVDGQPLVVSISQGDYHPVCAATYAGEVVACRASWNNTRPFNYYAVIEDDLGLPADRFGELAAQSAGSGWGGSDWQRLGAILAVIGGAGVAALLWIRTRHDQRDTTILRVVYTTGMAAMTFGFVWFAATWVLLTLQLID